MIVECKGPQSIPNFELWFESVNSTMPDEKPKTVWDSNEIFSLFSVNERIIFWSFPLDSEDVRESCYQVSVSSENIIGKVANAPALDMSMHECQHAIKSELLGVNQDEINSFLFFLRINIDARSMPGQICFRWNCALLRRFVLVWHSANISWTVSKPSLCSHKDQIDAYWA